MATVSDVTTTPLSGLNYIDALLDKGPDWNYLTPVGNTLTYTFSVASGTETGKTGQQAFTEHQQNATRTAFAYISELTGIRFVETAIGTNAQIHLCSTDLAGGNVTGLCSWYSSYTYSSDQLVAYDADAYVYLDNVEWAVQNSNLNPGTEGYETLLHELGHALGLKHPFDTNEENSTTLPAPQDNTANTIMSYTDRGGPYVTYSQYDVAALKWLYGGDGLRGALGINSATGARYIAGTSGADTLTGTTANDVLEGSGGNDILNGGGGTDTAVFRGASSEYTFYLLADGNLQVTHNVAGGTSDGIDLLSSIEMLRFNGKNVAFADIVSVPGAPTLAVDRNANGYASGSTPQVSGTAAANATVKIYTTDNVLVGSATAGDNGTFKATLNAFADGLNYQVYATATNAGGNTSAPSAGVAFNVDAHAPAIPTFALSYTEGSNQATFSGSGEAGTTIRLVQSGSEAGIAQTTVGSDGTWSVTQSLANGSYAVQAISADAAGNETRAGNTLSFAVASEANIPGNTVQLLRMYQAVSDGPAAVANPLGADAIDHIYGSILLRAAEAAGAGFWLNHMKTGSAAHAQVQSASVQAASIDLPEGQAQVVGSVLDDGNHTLLVA